MIEVTRDADTGKILADVLPVMYEINEEMIEDTRLRDEAMYAIETNIKHLDKQFTREAIKLLLTHYETL